ncbi:MAG: glutamate-1-semialdehyde 2,1-aminomutase [Candidatus Omnitrophica bacterium]|nr:glutamate-1-semialdehyde 2,1-aminomutase [Candidatus Omnitrophota bacterium]MBU1925140.1 glutamate-1-semialdehyde 2,1-aminomutase [Candidatus Omnitrophota bacterium]
MTKAKRSKFYYRQALKLMPAGVNSPVRAFYAVGGKPVFIKKGKGSRIYDVDGRSYIDYVLSWGPLILGHAHKEVIKATVQALKCGTSFGAPIKDEIELAKIITRAVPSMEMLRLVTSGTEAVMSAVRLARAFTKKNKIVKFEGCYHGHSDSLLVASGSGAATFGVPNSLGVPKDFAKNTFVLPYNDIDKVDALLKANSRNIAAVILEPVCGNMGVVLPRNNFLSELRAITKKHNVLLIFDEVITGFRFLFGGAQNLFKVIPDITCLGKIIGGGLALGAYGASREIMSLVSPLGGMYQAGTLSGNPVAVACGLRTLQILKKIDYNKIEGLTVRLCKNLEETAKREGFKIRINHIGSMFTVFFTKEEVDSYQKAKRSDTKKYAAFFNAALNAGIYIAPSQFEANFLSFAHSLSDVKFTETVFNQALRGEYV